MPPAFGGTEVQVTAQLDHPNVVPVNGFELAEDGSLGYSMKLIKGRDLDVWLQVDGGVTVDTIGVAAEAGADTFVAGSAVFRGVPEQQIEALRAAAASHAH